MRFITISLLFMAWAFYEMSGGKDFAPPSAGDGIVASAEAAVPDTSRAGKASGPAPQPEVARAAIDPAVGGLSIAVAKKTSLVSDLASDKALPTPEPAAYTADKVDAGAANIGEGTLRVVSLEMPAAAPRSDVQRIESERVVEMRTVAGDSVNMRNGPGTDYSIVTRLGRGEAVEVLQDPGNGWVKLRVEDSGRVGWMADFLLASAD